MENNNTDRSAYIHKYISKQLPEEEHLAFEQEMQNDPDLLNDVLFEQQVMLAYKTKNDQLGQTEIPQHIREMVNCAESNYKKERKLKYAIYSLSTVAAIVLLVVVFSGIFRGNLNEQLFNHYYVAPVYEYIPSRGGEDLSVEQQKFVEKGNEQYEINNYKEALSYYEKAILNTELTQLPPELLFYYCIALIEEHQYQKAAIGLSHIATNEQLFNRDAQWYLALVYLRTNQTDEALQCLENIIADESEYAAAAEDIRNKIK